MKKQKGMALLEVIVALALLGITGVLFLSGAVNSANARVQADEHATAKVLAESIIDTIKKMDYADVDDYVITVPDGYDGYTADMNAEYLYSGSNDIQKITVTIKHGSREVYSLENYKVNR